ncbi:MAG: insulinase family protein [Clostridia bacterium]|nr:insulinase family protein [Clostridia bacterium]
MRKQTKTYDNGLQLILERNEKQVVSVDILFSVGSQDENQDELGFAHFIEHMMFKGTKDMSAEDIMDKLTFYGADFNAFTSKTTTKYVFKCLAENFEECFKIYADMILNPEFKKEELDRERQVVIEEMKRSDDEPLDVLYRRTMENYFAGLSFAHDELGTEEIIENVSREKLLEFKNRFYKAENCVISVAGDIDFEELDRIVNENIVRFFDYKAEKHKVSFEPFNINISKKYDIVERDDNQANVCIHIKSVPSGDKDKYVSNLYASILGNSQNSRLFKIIREKLGLVYTIYAYNEVGVRSGELLIVFGTRPKNVKLAMAEIRKVIDDLAENGITEEELERTINWKKAGIAFGMETNSNIADVNCVHLHLYNEIFDENKRIKKIEAVTVEAVNEFAKRIANETEFNVVAVGKGLKIEDLKQF